MEISVDLRHLCDSDIFREQGIKPLVEGLTGYPTFRPEIRHLIQGMDPSIRPPGGRKNYLFIDDSPDPLLHYALDRPCIRLILPTVVIGPVIFDCKFNIAHRVFVSPHNSDIRIILVLILSVNINVIYYLTITLFFVQ